MTSVAERFESNVAETQQQGAALIQMIERAASNPAVDIDKMERLLLMQERVIARQAEVAFNDAMTQAQAQMPRIKADKRNKQTSSDYASYAALDRAIRDIYTTQGFSLSFDTGDGAPTDHVRVLCYVSHRAGHTRTYRADMPADGKGAKGGDVMTKTHAMGSGMQYGKRYLLQAIFNLAIGEDPADDDGNAASGPPRVTKDQIATLEHLLDESASDRRAFFDYFKVQSMADLPQAAYAQAVQMIQAKQRRGGK